jgi:transposase
VDERLPERLEALRQWDGTPVPAGMKARLLREFERWKQVDRQVRDLDNQRARAVRTEATPPMEQVRRLLTLKGIGWNGAWLLVHEVFGWRQIRNRRELAALVGLVPTPYASGESRREQGISKAGNRRVRWLMIELAWGWLRYQPQSDLSQWYQRRFGQGNARARKIGIVALARKLLVGLWRYLDHGEVPLGAETIGLSEKLCGRVRTQRQAS